MGWDIEKNEGCVRHKNPAGEYPENCGDGWEYCYPEWHKDSSIVVSTNPPGKAVFAFAVQCAILAFYSN